mmetsp:Transcript_10867/g.40543  ORF Transcript_10867/g.40543 Transcript_10867/m.40543 type:complete len:293 (-) Transcript_10867:107-985(-)
MNQLQDEQHKNETWFTELSEMWPGEGLSLQVDKVIHEEQSQYQHIVVFDTVSKGRVMCLDGVIQVTKSDEFAYQEMIAHLPLFSLKNPKKVLIIGGGDGGVIRECLKHDTVEEVHICEIDERVIEVSKEYLPWMSSHFNHEKVHIHIYDGAKFLQENKNTFDCIITDSSDPIGPAETLFSKGFYEMAHEALTDNGVLCCQAESIWLHLESIVEWFGTLKKIFANVEYAYTMIPTYPSGMIGFFMASKKEGHQCKAIARDSSSLQDQLRYYNDEIHKASFVLPQFAAQKLADA